MKLCSGSCVAKCANCTHWAATLEDQWRHNIEESTCQLTGAITSDMDICENFECRNQHVPANRSQQ